MLAQASRLNFSTRLFNLLVTNVPGPQFPLYVLGRELQTVVPVAFLPNKHALAVANFSYNGKLSFGLLGDLDAMDDLDVVPRRPGARARRAGRGGPHGDRRAPAPEGAGADLRPNRPRIPRGPKISGLVHPLAQAEDPARDRPQPRRGAGRRARLHVLQRGDRLKSHPT